VTQTRWKQIENSIEEFRKFLSSNIPKLSIVNATDKKWTAKQYKELKPKGFPSKLRGVYLIFDEQETLLYIGLSTTCFNKRIWKHDTRFQRRYIDIIPIGDNCFPLAPALEYFLITRHPTPGNKVYRNHKL
jgi:hypothetical protein